MQAGHIYEATCTAAGVSCNVSFLDGRQRDAALDHGLDVGGKAVLQYKFGTAGISYVKLLVGRGPRPAPMSMPTSGP